MAPRPPVFDPARGVDRLPQPYRMIDKLVSEIVERALEECALKDKQKKQDRATLDRMRFGPHAVLMVERNATCFTTPGIAGLAVVGTDAGEIIAHTARDSTIIGKDHPHSSAVTAMDSGHIPATGAKLVASASKGHIAINELVIKTAELILLAKVELPNDPDGDGHYPITVSFSSNAGHVAVCFTSGALAIYEINLPASYYASITKPKSSAVIPNADGSKACALNLVVHMSVANVRSLLVGSTSIGACRIEWQLQQRPDRSGKSDRFHKPARGVYMWWQDCNRIALSNLDVKVGPDIEPPAVELRATSPQKAAAGKPPSTPPPPPKVDGGSVNAAGKPLNLAQGRPNRGWLLPHGVTCSCITDDGTMLAFGMKDGSTLVWDDQFGGHIRILPRMPAAISALAYVHGMPAQLLCTSTDGSIYVADFKRPEDSYTAGVKLPLAASEVCFLAGDPLALFMCPAEGSDKAASRMPSMLWYDMNGRKLVAECVGKNKDFGFGKSCTYEPPTDASAVDPAAAMPDLSSSSTSTPASSRPFPRWSFKESYFIAGGPLQRSPNFHPPHDSDPEAIGDTEWPTDATLMLFKVDALARYLMPEENQSKASKTLLERMLAELNPPKKSMGKHVKYGIPDPDAPKPPPSSLRRASAESSGDEDDDARSTASGSRKHIAFGAGADADLFDDENNVKSSTKHFKKEMRSGGYSTGLKGHGHDPSSLGDVPTLPGVGPGFKVERPQSPPWHHTTPLARIHPDWEAAPVLARVMDRIGSKGGGRKKRERRLMQVANEMGGRLAKEPGAKPLLLVPKS